MLINHRQIPIACKAWLRIWLRDHSIWLFFRGIMGFFTGFDPQRPHFCHGMSTTAVAMGIVNGENRRPRRFPALHDVG